MDLLMSVLLLIVGLLISNIISHYLPSIPTALTQIGFGILIALLFRDISLEIETEWFLLLFVAPLLYNDGRHFPREELWKMRAPIFGNAIILVLLTTIGGGYFIHWLIPTITLAAAFALAAILSPTDPVAVNGIAKRIRIPEKVLHLVRGESLINDASGLVAFKYAVAAVVTGYFSLKEAIFDFTYMFLAGALLGLILGLLVIWVRFILRKQGINDVTFHSLLQVMTPFVIFIITEELLHASGVIAVVVAGIVHALVKERTETLSAEEQVLTENIWSIILFVLNGIVFLLLGLNIPFSMIESVKNPNYGNWLIIGYVLAIGIVILGIRYLWSYIFSTYEFYFVKSKEVEKPNSKTTLITSLTGVRGAVTMAGVLSIPYVIKSGAVFPERSLILFIAAGVILFTLLAATVFLPLLSKDEALAGEIEDEMRLNVAKKKILLSAINKLHFEMNEENEAVAYELIGEYKVMFQRFKPEPTSDERDTDHYQQKLREIRLLALKAERRYIHEEMDKGGMDQNVFESFEKSLDHREEALSNNAQFGILYLIGRMIRGWKKFRGQYPRDRETRIAKLRMGQEIQLKALQEALDSLEKYAKEHGRLEMFNIVILDYKRIINRLKTPTAEFNEKREEQKEELRLKVMDIERAQIRSMYETGEINRDQAKELRRFINYNESITLYEHVE
ncbi:Na+/H+ antiporter [Neobacillus drentensis]|uniref:Na+/H+ antiporter n=1 Tax=Neobacillus drentensis TaxID=220684 RepID=UPI002FFE2B7D